MAILEKIKKDISSQNIAHAYLFVGSDQAEQKEAADYLIKHLGVSWDDVIEVKPEDVAGKKGEIKAQAIKDFIRQISLTPTGKNRIGLIYGADKLNLSSANMLLKTLEEPPKYAIVILLATSEAIIETIKSRCRIIKGGSDLSSDQDIISLSDLREGSLKDLFATIEEQTKNENALNLLLGIEHIVRQELLRNPRPAMGELVSECEKSKKRIRGNANPRLASEALVLKIKEGLK